MKLFLAAWCVAVGSIVPVAGGAGWKQAPVSPVPAAKIHDDPGDGSAASPMRLSGGVAMSQILSKVMPNVPRDVLRQHVSGAVVMSVLIDPAGKVINASAISSSLLLREYYLNAVRQWTYKPFLANGEPVYVGTTVVLILDYGALD